MASGKSTTQRQATAAMWLGATMPSVPGTLYVALLTVAPTAGGGGTEVTGGSYARVAVSNVPGSWVNDGLDRVNAGVITFPLPTADWGTIVGFKLMSAASGGTQYYWGLLDSPVVIRNGKQRKFPAGALRVTEL